MDCISVNAHFYINPTWHDETQTGSFLLTDGCTDTYLKYIFYASIHTLEGLSKLEHTRVNMFPRVYERQIGMSTL